MSKIFVVSINQEYEETNNRIFSSFESALKLYLKICISEIKSNYLDAESVEILDSEEDFSMSSCSLMVYNHHEEKQEYESAYLFDLVAFEEFLESVDDVDEYITLLEKSLDDNVIPKPVLEAFHLSAHQD
jgi:hypothetical protein